MDHTEHAISVQGLSKRFRLQHESARSLKTLFVSLLFRRRDRRVEELWALRNVTFQVDRGQTVAVVGHNGSGKSTLLGLLARVYLPDTGTVLVQGRVAPLLELGAGFHEDLTGIENIALHGSILGLSERRVQDITPEVVAFAGLEHFIDTPIRSWSAGMIMRLGFSIAIHSDPDVLLIDEVLAVGDEAFQQKCYRRIRQFQEEGKTILFVSHDLDAVQKVAKRVIWLKSGQVEQDGPVMDILPLYQKAASTGDLRDP